MNATPLQSESLKLVAPTLEEVRAQFEGMDADQKAALPPGWVQAAAGADAVWTLGFNLVHRVTESVVGQCAFKGTPSADQTVEIAYRVAPEYQGRGYATEAANALVAFAFSTRQVLVVRAHTLREQNASTRVLVKCGFRNVGDVTDPEDGLVWRWEKHKDGG
jgi:[ribosomal protein S5]-alanine N-acetyltransferase